MIRLCMLFILSWALTVAVEGAAARIFFGIEKKDQLLLLLVNTVTNPAAVLLSQKSGGRPAQPAGPCLHRDPV